MIRKLNVAAFGQPQEAHLVDRLRNNCNEYFSLVAEKGNVVAGYILFTPVVLEAENGNSLQGMGLAPMAVLPEYQKQGIGSALVKEGLKKIKEKGYPFVIVIGHANHYPKFGFEPASTQ